MRYETDAGGPQRFTPRDRAILRSLEPVMDGIAELMGEQCEVVLHSLEDPEHSVVRVRNGHITGRKTGAPLTDQEMKVLRSALRSGTDVLPAGLSKTGDGKTLRSVTSVIRNDEGQPIGLFCTSLNLDAPVLSLLRTLLSNSGRDDQESSEHFVMNAEELVQRSVQEAIREADAAGMKPNLARNKMIVRELLARGIFDIRGAVDLVAREMGVSRYTVYNYLREVKC